MKAVPGIASEPIGVREDQLQLAVSPSFDALVDKVWSKELGVNEFMVELTEEPAGRAERRAPLLRSAATTTQ